LIYKNKPALYAKEIHQILEEQPIVTEIQIAHWNGLPLYVFHWRCVSRSYAECAFAESETVISQKNTIADTSLLSDDEFLVYEALQQQSALKFWILSILNKKNIFPVIQKLIDKNLVVYKKKFKKRTNRK
jgi:primosomal protein N' (replication factor Y)